MSKVYSYVRFSSKAQEFGDSQRRQFTRAQEYCRKKHLTLEKATFEDLEVSAWRGRNVDKGQLGVFLKAVLDVRAPQPDEPDSCPKLRAEIEDRRTKRKRLLAFIEDGDALDDDINERLNLLEPDIAEREEAIRKFDSSLALVPDESAEEYLLLLFEHCDAVHDGATPRRRRTRERHDGRHRMSQNDALNVCQR